MKQEVVLRDSTVELLGVREFRRKYRGEGGVEQVGTTDLVNQAAQPDHINGASRAEGVIAAQADSLQQPAHFLIGRLSFDFQPYGRPFSQVADFIFDGLQEVAGFLLVDVEVAIARNPESP